MFPFHHLEHTLASAPLEVHIAEVANGCSLWSRDATRRIFTAEP